MPRLLSLACLLALAAPAWAKDAVPFGPPGATLEQVQKSPSDEKIFGKYANAEFRTVNRLSDESPDAAETKLNEFAASLDKLELTDKALTSLERAKLSVKLYRDNIALDRVTLADVEKALLEQPDDADAYRRWSNKAFSEIGGTAYSRPDEAEAKLTALKAFVAKVSEVAKEEVTKKKIEGLSAAQGTFSRLEKAIAEGRKYAALVGKDAAPLVAKSWVGWSSSESERWTCTPRSSSA